MQTTFLTVGIACLIAAIVGGGLSAFAIQIPLLNSVPRQLALGVLGAAFIVYSIWLNPVPPPAIAIEAPKDGEKVDYRIGVHGTFSGKPPLPYIWGAVTPVSGDFQAKNEWWPQDQISPVGGKWNLACEIGDESKDVAKDKEYWLAVFLLDSEANASFWHYKNTWESNNGAPYELNKLLQTRHAIRCCIIKVVRK